MASHLYFCLTTWLRLGRQQCDGQDLVEYTVLVGLVTVACWIAVQLGGLGVDQIWAHTIDGLGAINLALGG